MTKAELEVKVEELNSLIGLVGTELDIAKENLVQQMEYSKYLMSMLNTSIEYTEFVAKYKIDVTFSEYTNYSNSYEEDKKQFLREKKIGAIL